MIKAIVFDCFGVLTTDTWRAFVDGLPPDADKQAARDLNHAYDAGMLTKDEFLKQVHAVTGHEPKQVETLLGNEIAKNAALLEYIRELKQNYKIGLLSNIGSSWITDTFLNADEQALFDEMVFSYKVGMTKPDPRIFELACSRLGVNPREAVMIDDIESYCASAADLGMKAVVYKNLDQCRADITDILAKI